MDNLTKTQRRKNMQNIKSKNSVAEVLLAKTLKRNKFLFSRNVKNLIGKPDFVFKKQKLIVFVDSDFWHRHPKRFVMPKSNTIYWKKKIRSNVERDKKITKALKKLGWKVLRLWEYDIKNNLKKCESRITKILSKL